MNKTLYQHFLPKFIIKKWSNIDEKIKYFNKLNHTYSFFNLKNKVKDPFIEKEFYENHNYDFNDIEMKLSKIENYYSKILTKIINKFDKYKTIRINRKELMIIKLFVILQSFRSKSSYIRMNNLEGDHLFNDIYKNNSSLKNKLIMLDNISIIYDIFLKIKSDEFVDLDFIKKFDKNMGSEFKYIELCTNSFLNFAKIENLSENFILTDQLSVQAVDPITHVPILMFMPISPKYCIIFTKTMYNRITYNSELADELARNVFSFGFKLIEKNFNKNFTKRNHRVIYRNKNIANYDDEFIYNILEMNNEEVWTLNGLIYSQAIDYIIYVKKEDIEKCQKIIDLKNIYRIEDY